MSGGRYEIRLKGHLGARWAVRFDGMTLTTRADGTTLIEGPVADQATLHGLLRTLRDLGLPLLSVTQVEPDEPRMTRQSRKQTPQRSPSEPRNPQEGKESRWTRPGELRS